MLEFKKLNLDEKEYLRVASSKLVTFPIRNNHFTFKDSDKKQISLNNINFIIGQNNSGKSYFMRSLALGAPAGLGLRLDKASPILEVIISEIKGLTETIEKAVHQIPSSEAITIIQGFHLEGWYKNIEQGTFPTILDVVQKIEGLFSYIGKAATRLKVQYRQGNGGSTTADVQVGYFEEHLKRLVDPINTLKSFLLEEVDFCYIPSFRSMQKHDQNSGDNYLKGLFEKNYMEGVAREFKNSRGSLFIHTGEEMYQDFNRKLRGTHYDRNSVARYEDFLSKYFFDGKGVTIIPTYKENFVTIKIDEEEKPIHHLGDGLQQIVLITYLAFLNQRKTVFFIEEPELYIHAGLQRRLISAMRNEEFKRHTFILSTHSNHFLDLVFDYDDLNLFSVRKICEGDHEIESVGLPRRELLVDLGVRDSSVFLTNATIWVEGVHDRRILQALIERYQELAPPEQSKFYLNKHYTIVEYGGANLPHFLFDHDRIDIDTFRGNNFFLFDGDVEESKGWKKERIEKELKDNFQILNCKEIENTAPPSILVEVLKARWSRNTKIRSAYNDHGEAILKKISESGSLSGKEFYSAKEGTSFHSISYIIDLLVESYGNDENCSEDVRSLFVSDKKTIKNKEQFSMLYSRALKDYQLLADSELTKLAEKIYKFIEALN